MLQGHLMSLSYEAGGDVTLQSFTVLPGTYRRANSTVPMINITRRDTGWVPSGRKKYSFMMIPGIIIKKNIPNGWHLENLRDEVRVWRPCEYFDQLNAALTILIF
jgi:hypothetical protein